MHVLVLAMAPRQFLVNMDRLVRASVTSWVGIPRHSALGLIHGGIASGGLSVPRLAKVVPLLQRDRLQSLARSAGGDEVLAAVIKTEYYGKLVARSLKAVKVGTAGVVVTSRQQVDAEYSRWLKEDAPDGCVARGIDFNVKSGRWLSMAHFLGQLSGAEVKQMIKVRLGLLPTPNRLGRIGQDSLLHCDCRTRHNGSLGHIMQKCARSKPARMKRHNEVAKLLARYLVERGFRVTSEPRLRTAGGVKVPDLVAINGESKSALVLEVVICSSTDIINSRYTDKLVKYDTVEVRECVALETSGLTAGAVEVLPVVLIADGRPYG